jgi:hypothetical protein
MKTSFLFILHLSAIVSVAQITHTTNTGGSSTDFVGWSNSNPFPLLIDHRETSTVQPIVFSTGAGLGGERLRILDIPNGNFLQGSVGLVNPIANNGMTRVRINYDAAAPVGTAGVVAASLLHIGTDWFPNAATGVRDWQNLGMTVMAGSQHLFLGMREKDCLNFPNGRTSTVTPLPTIGAQEKDAVLNWGDNYQPCHPINSSQTNLCFIFTSHGAAFGTGVCTSTNEANSNYGLEIMRLSPGLNNTVVPRFYGSVGIGPAFTDTNEPQAMLHINSPGTDEASMQISQNANNSGTLGGLTIGLLPGSQSHARFMLTHQNADMQFHTLSSSSFAQRMVIKGSGNIGMGTNTPGNEVEIATTNTAQPYFPFNSTWGSSGLRFTNLTATNTPIPSGTFGINPGEALTVDINGDVVKTNIFGSAVPLGNQCTLTPNPLLSEYEIPTNSFNFNFTGDGNNTDKVSFGLACGTMTGSGYDGKVNIATGFATEVTGSFANGVVVTCSSSTQGNSAISGFAYNGSSWNSGVGGVSLGGGVGSWGGGFYAQGGSALNIGVSGTGYGGNALQAQTYLSLGSPSANIGVYGRSGSGVVREDFAGFFDGDLYVNGHNSFTGMVWATSDQMFKTNIDTIPNALQTIHLLQPKTFFMDTANIYGMRFDSERQYGVIAQQAQSVLPAIVHNLRKPPMIDTLGNITKPGVSYKAVNYTALIAIMLRGIQQLSEQVNQQSQQISDLKQCTGCGNESQGRKMGSNTQPDYQMDVTLKDLSIIILNQNDPNPMKEHCVITYDIPVDFKVAQIVFKTVDGRIIKAVDITQKGKGQLNVFASDLSNGIYSYYLMLDGQIIDTKKLVKQD